MSFSPTDKIRICLQRLSKTAIWQVWISEDVHWQIVSDSKSSCTEVKCVDNFREMHICSTIRHYNITRKTSFQCRTNDLIQRQKSDTNRDFFRVVEQHFDGGQTVKLHQHHNAIADGRKQIMLVNQLKYVAVSKPARSKQVACTLLYFYMKINDRLVWKSNDCNLATRHFVWPVCSPGTVSHWTFVPHLHYQLSKKYSRHIFSHVPTSLTNCFAEYEQRTLYSALVVTLAKLLHLINCRFTVTVRERTIRARTDTIWYEYSSICDGRYRYRYEYSLR